MTPVSRDHQRGGYVPSVPQLIAVYTCKLISQSMGNISNPFFSTAKPHEDSCLQNFQLTSPLQVVKVETNRKGQRAMVVAIHFD